MVSTRDYDLYGALPSDPIPDAFHDYIKLIEAVERSIGSSIAHQEIAEQ